MTEAPRPRVRLLWDLDDPSGHSIPIGSMVERGDHIEFNLPIARGVERKVARVIRRALPSGEIEEVGPIDSRYFDLVAESLVHSFGMTDPFAAEASISPSDRGGAGSGEPR